VSIWHGANSSASLKRMAKRSVDALNKRKTQSGNECAVWNWNGLKGESLDADANLLLQDKFHTGIFLAIIDGMTGALKKRLYMPSLYSIMRNLFGVFCMKSLIWLCSRLTALWHYINFVSAKVPSAWLKHIRKIWNTIWRMNLCSFAASPAAAAVVSSKGRDS